MSYARFSSNNYLLNCKPQHRRIQYLRRVQNGTYFWGVGAHDGSRADQRDTPFSHTVRIVP